ncbi:ATP-grasp domain-containing protein [Neobacillus notoginsengisoli]|uniref:ATP-grasp domain-containing protein n=1 Tax=Neobacillus notoginsengisoli TaxID=1578198 RepID=A0A417YSL1_9BACI|nr:ATP-grasp domain-containing protein [Neobacillus notoginsengisoli]RHW38963.1 ATP-grasp domain-containing protein [Neobacillus notoginsengisoli]
MEVTRKQMDIAPTLTLKDIYGPQLVFNPRVSFEGIGWIPKDTILDDFRTGALLPIAGDMPFVCNDRTVTEEALNLLKTAGISPAPNQLVYDGKNSFYGLLESLSSGQQKKVLNQPLPDSEVPPEKYWIDKEVFSYLNNKANMGEIVPKEHLPKRMVVSPDELVTVREKWTLPFVMKAGTDLPNGGGFDVVLCHTEEDFKRASELLKDSQSIVIEEFIENKKNYCLQFAKTCDGQILYLGAGEQIISVSGRYKGNWISAEDSPPKSAINLGRTIMEKACQLGYKGIAGFDILITEDNRVLCIDLNFRLNGSTPALLLKDSIFSRHNNQDMMFKSWKIDRPWDEFHDICKSLVEDGSLIPLAIYHPETSGDSENKPFINGILIGNSKEEILQKEQYLTEHGWK